PRDGRLGRQRGGRDRARQAAAGFGRDRPGRVRANQDQGACRGGVARRPIDPDAASSRPSPDRAITTPLVPAEPRGCGSRTAICQPDGYRRVMQLPVIIAVDGSTHVLDAVERELAERYARRYRIERAQSVARAVERLNELVELGTDLALILVGQSLLDTTGGDALDVARRLHPHAKRALLVSPGALTRSKRADLIRGAMAVGRIDHFVREPGQSPDEVFHEAISGFLLEWARERRLVPQTVHIVGQHWSGRAYELRAVLESCAVPHTFCLADSDQGRELLAMAGQDAKLPLMVLPDGTALSDPTNAQIAAAAGAPEGVEHETFDLLVVGAGPAGLSAAVYGAAEGLRGLVVAAGGLGGPGRP